MSGSRFFDRRTASWAGESLCDYLRFRTILLRDGVNGSGALTKGSRTDRGRLPVLSLANTYASKLVLAPDLYSRALKTPADQFIFPNPYVRTEFRGGIGCWDGVLGLPDPNAHLPGVFSGRGLLALRDINTHWAKTIQPALSKTGPLGGAQSPVVRPSGAYVYDLMRANPATAWGIMDMAQALVCNSVKAYVRGNFGELAARLRTAVSEVVAAMLYGLPIHIGGPRPNRTLPYGLEIVADRTLQLPSLMVPAYSEESPRIDESVVYLLAATYTQPHPSKLYSGTLLPGKLDRWCGLPTVVAVVGWETVDYLSRQVLVTPPHRLGYYGIPAPDLMPPQYLWAHLALAASTGTFPSHETLVEASAARIADASAYLATVEDSPDYADIREMLWQRLTDEGLYMYPQDWRNTGHYTWFMGRTPPMPYAPCLALNPEAEGAPKRPIGFAPRKGRDIVTPDWRRWYEDTNTLVQIVDKAVSVYESGLYGYSTNARRRRERLCAWKKINKELFDRARLAKIRKKEVSGKRPTLAEEKFLRERRQETNRLAAIAATMPPEHRPLKKKRD